MPTAFRPAGHVKLAERAACAPGAKSWPVCGRLIAAITALVVRLTSSTRSIQLPCALAVPALAVFQRTVTVSPLCQFDAGSSTGWPACRFAYGANVLVKLAVARLLRVSSPRSSWAPVVSVSIVTVRLPAPIKPSGRRSCTLRAADWPGCNAPDDASEYGSVACSSTSPVPALRTTTRSLKSPRVASSPALRVVQRTSMRAPDCSAPPSAAATETSCTARSTAGSASDKSITRATGGVLTNTARLYETATSPASESSSSMV
ncbi:hypothetical protein GCM10027277_07840 [Pseudoduganella ginsengisoli]